MTTEKNISVHPLIKLPKTLVMVRHGQSVGNIITANERARRIESNHNFALTPAGFDQARSAGAWLKRRYGKNYFPICFYSTLKRTEQTLHTILRESKVGDYMVEDSRLDEKWDGIFHDLSEDDIAKYYPEQAHLRSRTGYYHHRAPGGENCPDVERRIREFFVDLDRHGIETVLMCCHGSWLLTLRRLLHGWTTQDFAAIRVAEAPPNCGIYIYNRSGEPGSYQYDYEMVNPSQPDVVKTELA